MDKAPDAYRTISEVADDLDLQQHVLRFWESRFSQIRPLKRGGGRRYYRPDDVELLKGIRHLLYKEGYTIKGVQRILKEQGARAVQAFAREQQPEVVFEPEDDVPPRQPVPMPSTILDEVDDIEAVPMTRQPEVILPALPEQEEDEPFDTEDLDGGKEPDAVSAPPVMRAPSAEPVPRGKVSMFRGGLQRPETTSDSTTMPDLSGRMAMQRANPSPEAHEPLTPGLTGRASLQLALDELTACRARIDRILARR